ncbi:MAG: peptidase [Methylotenera sp.]|nr:MAG: peptidase [Methylotenera sp.]
MTYCVGLLLEQGLVFASDTRTNAGIDQVAISPKMHIFEVKDERVIVLMTSGNLAITQSVVNSLKLKINDSEKRHLKNVDSLFEAASLVGDEIRASFARDGAFLKDHDIEFNATILIGGQIKGEIPRLFKVYAAGNFIEIGQETPYFQIGETKYGKPIIDRVVKYDTDMMDAVKCLLISFDSTIRSNVSVAAPIDLLIYRIDSLNADCKQRITENDPYYSAIRQGWGTGLKQVFSALPSPDWC